MVYSHCIGPGLVQGPNGKYSIMQKCSHWPDTGTGTTPIVSYCVVPVACTSAGLSPVQCEKAIRGTKEMN